MWRLCVRLSYITPEPPSHKKKCLTIWSLSKGICCAKKISFSITRRNPSGNFPLSQSIGKHRTWKSIKWNTIKFVFFITSSTRQEAMVDTTLSLFSSFSFQNKKEGHKTSKHYTNKKERSKNVIWEWAWQETFFFFLFTSSPKSPTSTTENHKRKSQKISFIKYLSWNECSWRLISLCQ